MEWFSPRAFFRSSSGIMAPLVCCLVLSGSLASCVAKLISMASKLSRKRRFSSCAWRGKPCESSALAPRQEQRQSARRRRTSLMCPNCCVDSSAAAPPARGSARGGASSACILILRAGIHGAEGGILEQAGREARRRSRGSREYLVGFGESARGASTMEGRQRRTVSSAGWSLACVC